MIFAMQNEPLTRFLLAKTPSSFVHQISSRRFPVNEMLLIAGNGDIRYSSEKIEKKS